MFAINKVITLAWIFSKWQSSLVKQSMNQQPWITEYLKKQLLEDVHEIFFPGTFVKVLNGIICIQFENLRNIFISQKILQFYLQASKSNK